MFTRTVYGVRMAVQIFHVVIVILMRLVEDHIEIKARQARLHHARHRDVESLHM